MIDLLMGLSVLLMIGGPLLIIYFYWKDEEWFG